MAAAAAPYSEKLPGLDDLPDDMNDLLRQWNKNEQKMKEQIAEHKRKKKERKTRKTNRAAITIQNMQRRKQAQKLLKQKLLKLFEKNQEKFLSDLKRTRGGEILFKGLTSRQQTQLETCLKKCFKKYMNKKKTKKKKMRMLPIKRNSRFLRATSGEIDSDNSMGDGFLSSALRRQSSGAFSDYMRESDSSPHLPPTGWVSSNLAAPPKFGNSPNFGEASGSAKSMNIPSRFKPVSSKSEEEILSVDSGIDDGNSSESSTSDSDSDSDRKGRFTIVKGNGAGAIDSKGGRRKKKTKSKAKKAKKTKAKAKKAKKTKRFTKKQRKT